MSGEPKFASQRQQHPWCPDTVSTRRTAGGLGSLRVLPMALASLLAGILSATGATTLKGAERLARPTVPPATSRTINPTSKPNAPVQIKVGTFLGWERSLHMSNGKVEALIVPAIGRIMSFRFVGDEGPEVIWDDSALRGKSPDPASTEWINFGGDKSWPAPQADWPKVTPRGWPPPVAFDSMPAKATVRRDTVVVTTPVDPHYGIRCERAVRLVPDEARMVIVTTYEKVEGPALDVGIWIITQLTDPEMVAFPVPPESRFAEGFNRQSGDLLPAQLRSDRGLISLRRDPAQATKIGTDADRLLWVGPKHQLLIESPRQPGLRYPDQESSAEIYTNPNPKAYVELEMLGPLHSLKPGDRITQTNTYTLLRRTHADPLTDARRVLK